MTIDLTTQFGGLTLASPIIVGANPMTAKELTRIAFVNAGAGAIVLPSLFEEQVRQPKNASDTDSYLALVEQAGAGESVPVIASINGGAGGDWLDVAVKLEAAGASAIEFNIHRQPRDSSSDSHQIEEAIVEAAARISQSISIPLFLKLGRDYTSVSHLARRLLNKADGLVLFGYAPEVDISMETLQVESRWGLTEPGSVARSIEPIMRLHSVCPEMALAAGGGIGSADDVAKVLLAGADVAMITSAVYRDGPDVIASFLDSLRLFMQRHDMNSFADLKARRPALFDNEKDRAGYIDSLTTPPVPDTIRSANRVLHCDRWGHVTVD